MKLKTERFNKDAYRITKDGEIVAFALRMSNDKWGAFDANERRITGRTFEKPKDVRDWFEESTHDK